MFEPIKNKKNKTVFRLCVCGVMGVYLYIF